MPMRSRLTNTPATVPRSAGHAGFLLDDRGQHQGLVGRLQRRVRRALRPRPRSSWRCIVRVGALEHREVADAAAVERRCRERSGLRPGSLVAPSAAISCASVIAGVAGFRCGARASSARNWRNVQPSIRRTRSSNSSPCTILSSSCRGVMPAPRSGSCRRGCVAPGPTSGTIRTAARRHLHAGLDPGLRDLARRGAGFDRQLDAWLWPAAAAAPATATTGCRAADRQHQHATATSATTSCRALRREASSPCRTRCPWTLMIIGAHERRD